MIEEIARAIDPKAWEYFDSGVFPKDHPAAQGVVRKSLEAAERVWLVVAEVL